MRTLLAGVAAIAFAASAAIAAPGGGHGGGGGGGHGGGGGGHGPAGHGGGGGPGHGGGGGGHGPMGHGGGGGHGPMGHGGGGHGMGHQARPAMHHAPAHQARPQAMHGNPHRAAAPAHHGGNPHAASPNHAAQMHPGGPQAMHPGGPQAMHPGGGGAHMGPGDHAVAAFPQGRPDGNRMGHPDGNRPGPAPANFRWSSVRRDHRAFDGCPPGLAKKYNGCLPPGLAKQWSGPGYYYDRPQWYGYAPAGYDYRYYDGYMLRMGAGDNVLAYLPLLGGALAVGEIWPAAYEPVDLPPYYARYYGLGPPDSYRYYDDTLFSVDPQTSRIRAVVALLTGEDFVIGRPIPVGYDVYNVPYPYRSRYYDTPDSWYRYSDGYVYQVDPKTRLIVSAIALLS